MGSCNFSFLKNTRVEINSKLNEKSRMITLNAQPHTEGFRVLTLGHTRKVIPPPTAVQDGEGSGILEFLIC